jgi:IS1 family transposase
MPSFLLTCYIRFSIIISTMNRLSTATRAQMIACLVDGCSIRATTRICGVSKKAALRLLVDVGQVCSEYQDRMLRNLRPRRIQIDEVWSWIECKKANITEKILARNPHAGDVWLYVALDSDTKLVLSHQVGARNAYNTYAFMRDVASRIQFVDPARPLAEQHRVQLTTDGMHWYPDAVDQAFGANVDYAVQVKEFGGAPADASASARYSPSRITSVETEVIKGNPDPHHISTSFVERQNWTVRTNLRRYTRLSNGFSRKLENHAAAVSLQYFVYNFIRIHRKLRMTPAMAAGVTTRLWEVSDLVALLETSESKKAA